MRVRRASRLAGGLATAATAVGLMALLSGGGGCELAVSQSLPSFTCLPDAADVCPSGWVCVPATHQCVPRSGTCSPGAANVCGQSKRCDAQTLRCVQAPPGPDATGEADATPASMRDSMPDALDAIVGEAPPPDGTGDAPDINIPDGTSDGPTTCHGNIGCGCMGSTDCNTGICADKLTLTPALFAVVGMNVCTKPCCTSSDCPNGNVCFGTGGGGNYCVPPKWIGRNTGVGGAQGGAACTGGADCKSGLCTMGTCADTCCSTAQEAAECASGTVCRFAQFPGNSFDTHVTAWCGLPIGSTAAGMNCAVDITCQSGKCNVPRCEAVCRTSSDCGTGFACSYGLAPTTLPTNKDIIEGCMPSTGPTPNGGNCTSNSDCQSAFCDGTMHCTDACATDIDCKTGMHCQPSEVMVQGSYSVLACE